MSYRDIVMVRTGILAPKKGVATVQVGDSRAAVLATAPRAVLCYAPVKVRIHVAGESHGGLASSNVGPFIRIAFSTSDADTVPTLYNIPLMPGANLSASIQTEVGVPSPEWYYTNAALRGATSVTCYTRYPGVVTENQAVRMVLSGTLVVNTAYSFSGVPNEGREIFAYAEHRASDSISGTAQITEFTIERVD